MFPSHPLPLSEAARAWGGRPGDCPVTERIADTLVRLPLYPDLADTDVARIVDAVTAFAP